METHKRATALETGEGLTYLAGENQQVAHVSLVVEAFYTSTSVSCHAQGKGWPGLQNEYSTCLSESSAVREEFLRSYLYECFSGLMTS